MNGIDYVLMTDSSMMVRFIETCLSCNMRTLPVTSLQHAVIKMCTLGNRSAHNVSAVRGQRITSKELSVIANEHQASSVGLARFQQITFVSHSRSSFIVVFVLYRADMACGVYKRDMQHNKA